MYRSNILFIWLGLKAPLYEWRTKCIRRAVETYPEAKFKAVTFLKVFFGFKTIEPPDIGIDYADTMKYSDHLRMQYLSKHPYTLYLDTDTWCKKPIEFTESAGNGGFEAIWNGSQTSDFEDIYKKHREENLLYSLSPEICKIGGSLKEYFEHKPKWAKKYMRSDLQIFNPE